MPDSPNKRRPRLLVLNQYYRPGVEATAQLLADLCEALADTFDVTVVTGRLRGHGLEGGHVDGGRVRVIRVHSTAFDRALLFPRAANYLTYLGYAARAGFAADRPDVVLCMTDPPMVADVAVVVARHFRVPLVVISQDVFPEVAVELGRLENPVLVATLRLLIGAYLKRADRVVAIGETMRGRLEEKGVAPERLRVIPNWVDTKQLAPKPKANRWALRRGLEDSFVVMHSGNVGHAQDLDTLVRAATFLRDLDRLVIMIIGTGARRGELRELAERLEVDQVKFLPYQPRELLSESLSAADVHVVGLARGLAGYVVPSRIYGVLAVARPVIVAAESGSETAKIVEQVGCGVVVPPGRPELLAKEIRRAYHGELELAEMGERGRAYVTAEADRGVAVRRYRAVLAELLDGEAASESQR